MTHNINQVISDGKLFEILSTPKWVSSKKYIVSVILLLPFVMQKFICWGYPWQETYCLLVVIFAWKTHIGLLNSY